jgi:septum formation protein
MMTTLILASASPRRKELLEQIGVHFSSLAVDIDESVRSGELPAVYVERLAREKAQAGFDRSGNPDALVLGSDTSVVIDDHILGKPSSEEEAVAMLMSLSGKEHQVMTAIAVVGSGIKASQVVTTQVQFNVLDEKTCRQYWATEEPADKAGAYGIQGLGAVFVKSLSGSYTGVVGLPLTETAALLQKHGITIWHR